MPVELQKLEQRRAHLKMERDTWISQWQDISEYLLPFSGRFFVEDRNRGDKKHRKIYDSTGTRALRTLAAGMATGVTSPSRPWFRLTTSDPTLDEGQDVKVWLADVQRLMEMVFAKSNTYRALHNVYEELAAFGTSSTIVLPDFKTVLHHYPSPLGEFSIGMDHRNVVDTLYREFQMTVGQMVKEFGHDKVSTTVRNLYDRGTMDAWLTVCHAIEPRPERDVRKRDNQNMPWRSVYWEPGRNKDQPLRESGFKEFPALAPRWAVTGGDIYGNSPAMEALGDVQQLQFEQVRKGEGIDYQTRPPLQLPTSMKSRDVDLLPGGVSYVDAASPTGGIRSAFDVNLRLDYLLMDIQDVRERIRSSFFTDIFMMISADTGSPRTAYEIASRNEEKMMMLGPVLERLHDEILNPLIEMAFSRIVEAGIVPPPPSSLQGRELNVEFVSILAQAQRSIATNSVDRFVMSLGQIATLKPEALDKFDADAWSDFYSDALGIDPNLIVPGEQVTLIRQQRAEAQQAAQQLAMVEQAAGAAQKLAGAKTGERNALTDLSRGMG